MLGVRSLAQERMARRRKYLFSKLRVRVPDAPIVASEIRSYALTRAQWANLLRAIEKGHVTAASVRRFLRKLETKLVSSFPSPNSTTPSYFLGAFRDVVCEADQKPNIGLRFSFKDRRRGLWARWGNHVPTSVQTCYMLHRWFRGAHIPGIESDKPDLPTITRAVEYFSRHKSRLARNRLVGRLGEAVWLTPVLRTETAISPPPDRMRDRLGLFKNKTPRHAIVVVLANSVGDLPSDSCGSGLRAPTVWDARGYERFRHWPAPRASVDATAGRTYDLDAASRGRSVSHGLPELVHAPQPLRDCHALVHHGRYSTTPDGTPKTHQQFADEVAGARTLQELVEQVLGYV